VGYALVQLVEALRYVPENRIFDSQCCPPGRIVALGSNHRVIKVSTMNISWGVKETGTILLKSGRLKLLETAGPIQGCTGIASTLTKYHAGTPVICATGNRKVLVGA
jgi:hypothetical protein